MWKELPCKVNDGKYIEKLNKKAEIISFKDYAKFDMHHVYLFLGKDMVVSRVAKGVAQAEDLALKWVNGVMLLQEAEQLNNF